MRTKSVLAAMLLAAVIISGARHEARAGFPLPPLPGSPNVSINLEGYLPAPPGVHILVDSGRPYYVENDKRVYIEKEKPAKHQKKKKHEDNGRKLGHYK